MTICIQCHHFLKTDDDWYGHFCMASPLAKAIDPVTGTEAYRDGGPLLPLSVVEQPYRYCRDMNDGNCPLYEEKP